jgi:hypothetical protein
MPGRPPQYRHKCEKRITDADTYWIPIGGEDGLFIHFGNNITEWVKEELCDKN